MRIATWNVNSLKQRLPRLLPWLDERRPDVVCLQETKLTDDAFRELMGDELSDRGYEVAAHGEARVERRRDPVAGRARGRRHRDRGRARLPAPGGAGGVGDVRRHPRRLASTCRTAGRPDSDHYAYKLEWLEALTAMVAARPAVDGRAAAT